MKKITHGVFKKIGISLIGLVVAVSCGQAGAAERRISVAEYRDRMQAAWIGQVAGVAWGAPTEFKSNWKIIPANAKYLPKAWRPQMINDAFGQDDLYVEMTFIDTLDRRGWDVTARAAGIDFANSSYRLWHANFVGRDNLRKGIAPPDSSNPIYNKCANCIDYQIEADYSGILMPGYPQGAVILGEKFGRLMNCGDGLHAGQFVGAMYAEAYVERDRVKIVEKALKAIPAESRYAEMVRDMLGWYREMPKDWEAAWHRLVGKYGHEKSRCDKGQINCVLNGGAVLLGLLWGEGDPDRTILISTRSGFDSDCNPSSAAGVLFCSIGKAALPKRFYEAMDTHTKFEHTNYDFPTLFAVCEKVTREAIVKEGGRIEKDAQGTEWLVLPQKPLKPTPYRSWLDPAPQTGDRYTEAERREIKFIRDSGWGKPSVKASAKMPTASVQAALDKVFPGWRTTENAPDLEPGLRLPPKANGSDAPCVMTHPLRETPATLWREVELPAVAQSLVVSASADRNGDWTFEAKVNGETVCTRKVTPKTPLEVALPLDRWAGRKVKLELLNRADGWAFEEAFWHRIELVSRGTARPLRGPSMKDIRLGGHVGAALDRHIANGMAKKDADAYAAVFSNGKIGKLGPWAGEYWGKWLMAAAPALTYSGNAELKAKIARTVDYVLANQYADGYIGDVPVAKRFKPWDWDIWCRKYTSLGLLAYYRETGDARALKAVCRLCDHLMGVVGPGKQAIALTGTHHGFASMGVLQVFSRLAALTGEKKYRDYAAYIADQMERGPKAAKLVSNALAGKDIGYYSSYGRPYAWDNSSKSYEMTTCYIGLLDWFRAGGGATYRDAACRAADSIARTEIMIIGSGNTQEQWCGGATRQTLPFVHPNEGCTKAVWMHLCRELLETTGDTRWADEFEKTLYNGYLAGLSPDGSRFQMYQALFGRRGDGPKRNQCGLATHCCNEICPFGFIDLLNSTVMTDGRDAYVAQYVPGRVTVELEGAGRVEIVQETDYPANGRVRFTVNPERPARFALNVRVPGWFRHGTSGWKAYAREWKRGDTLEVEWPITVVRHRQANHLAFTAGPIALARDTRYGDGDIDEPIELKGGKNPTRFRPDDRPHPGRWISYVAELGHWDGHGAYDNVPNTRQIRFCDFSSAANTWDDKTRCRVWCPEAHYRPAD